MAVQEGRDKYRAWMLQPVADMSIEEFQDWQHFLEVRTGIVVAPERRTFLVAKLFARMRELGLSSYSSYLELVRQGPRGAMEWSQLLDRLTVQETRFFRHLASFQLLQRYLKSWWMQTPSRTPLAMWSLGCSTGEEAYSLAILADQILRNLRCDGAFSITGTDISPRALAQARKGCYSRSRLSSVKQVLVQTYFSLQADGRFQVLPDLAKHLCFAQLNVLDLVRSPTRGMNVIFCQNLLIYFRPNRRHEILNDLVDRLVPGGLLVIGVGEVVNWQHKLLRPVANDQVLAFIRKQ